MGFEPAIRTGVCRFGIGPFTVSVQVTNPLSVVVAPIVVAQVGADVLVTAALPIATSVQVTVPSVVVAPTVVAQVGAVGVPEVPAVVHRWVLPLESTIRFCDVYA